MQKVEVHQQFSDSKQSLTEKLEKLGLSRLESKIFVELFLNGPRIASNLSKTLDVNRVDVYRSMKRLRQRGILEVAFTRPLSFSAVEPEVLVEALSTEQELALRAFKKELDVLRKDLSSVPRNHRSEILEVIENMQRDMQFELKYGRQIFEKWRKMVESTKKEMMIILSHVGLMTHSIEGFSDLYSRAAKRGVSIKMITAVDNENYDQALEFSKTCSIKVSSSVNEILRYVISDEKQLMISGGHFSNDPKEFTAICTNNPLLIRALRLDFKEKWRRSKSFCLTINN